MKVGTLEIEGTLDSSGITSSLSRIEESLKGTATQTKTVLGPMTRLGNELSSALKKATLLGITGVGAMTALATKAPAVAPAIAKMGIEMMKISHSLGEVMAPIFDTIADDLLPAIGSAIDNNREKIEAFINYGVMGVDLLSSAIDKLFGKAPETTSKGVISAIEDPEAYLKSVGAIPKTGMDKFVEFSEVGRTGWEMDVQAQRDYAEGRITRGEMIGQTMKAGGLGLLQGLQGVIWLFNSFMDHRIEKDTAYAEIDAAGN